MMSSNLLESNTITVILRFFVKYAPDAQKATVTYIDDTDKKNLKTDKLTGYSNETSDYRTTDSITTYKNEGYVLVSDGYPADGMKFDTDDKTDQAYEVHLKHGQTTVTPEKPGTPGQPINPKDPRGSESSKYPNGTDAKSLQSDVPRTINYVYKTGTKGKQGTAAPSVKDSKHYEETKVIDKVTGDVLSDTWTPAQGFDTITSPTIKGYTPDRATVSNIKIAHNHDAIVETVTYTPDAQKADVTYIDDTTGQTLKQDSLTGVSDEKSDYSPTSQIHSYVDQGYVLVSNDFPADGMTFDEDDSTDQHFYIHLKHGQTTVTPEKPGTPGQPINPNDPNGPKYPSSTDQQSLQKTVHRTINYRYPDGTVAQPAHHDSLTFNKTEVIDKVTGKVISETWSGSQDFPDVSSPSLSGYTVDRTVVSDHDITYDHDDVVETVTYTAIPQTETSHSTNAGHSSNTGGTTTNVGTTTPHSEINPSGPETAHQSTDGSINGSTAGVDNQSQLSSKAVQNAGSTPTTGTSQNATTAKLPQTGDHHSSLAAAGLGMLGLTWLFGLFGKRKHN